MSTMNITHIQPSPTNPRKRFDEEKLRHLAETIRAQGILQALLVRPSAGGSFEIVDGERRWRAAQLVGLEELPVEVREMSDAQVIEVQLIAGDTSEPLTPIEEAAGLRRALALEEGGEPLYTKEALAAKLGRTRRYVDQLLQLLRLPDPVQAAVERGEIDYSVALLLARIPREDERIRAAAEIMPTATRPEPMTRRQAEAWIRERFCMALRDAPFDVAAAELPGPEGAPLACLACDRMESTQGNRLCTAPACYRGKCNAVWEERKRKAEAAGLRVLSDEQAEEVFERHAPVVQVAFNSPYVAVDTKPSYRHVKNEVEDKKLPTWRQLIESAEREKGIKVPIVIARDRTGRAWELVQVSLAIEAAKAIGEDFFKKAPVEEAMSTGDRFERDAVRSAIRGTDDFEQKRKAEAEASKKRGEEALEALRQIVKAGAGAMTCRDQALWGAVLRAAGRLARKEGQALVVRALGLKTSGGDFEESDAIEKHFAKVEPKARAGVVLALLAAAEMKYEGLKAEAFADVGAALGVTVESVRAALQAGKKEKAPRAKVKKKATAGARALAAVRASMPKGVAAR